jgi:hypothetical protein
MRSLKGTTSIRLVYAREPPNKMRRWLAEATSRLRQHLILAILA